MNGRLVLPFFRLWVFFSQINANEIDDKIKRGGLCASPQLRKNVSSSIFELHNHCQNLHEKSLRSLVILF